MTASSGGRGSPRAPVPNSASTIQSAPASCSANRAASWRLPNTSIGTPACRKIWKFAAGVARQFGRIGPDEHADLVPREVEVPGDDEAVARVVAFAAADDDAPQAAAGLGLRKAAEDIRRAAAGVFHEDQPRHAVLLDRPPIDLAGLFSGNGGGHREEWSEKSCQASESPDSNSIAPDWPTAYGRCVEDGRIPHLDHLGLQLIERAFFDADLRIHLQGLRSDFELLIRGAEKPVCPSCGKKHLTKSFSVPAAHSASRPRSFPAAGRLRHGPVRRRHVRGRHVRAER